jgi:hypothetical protein
MGLAEMKFGGDSPTPVTGNAALKRLPMMAREHIADAWARMRVGAWLPGTIRGRIGFDGMQRARGRQWAGDRPYRREPMKANQPMVLPMAA